MGVLFDFTGNDKNTTVQKVEDMVKEQWFHDAIQEEPDFFLLAGYAPPFLTPNFASSRLLDICPSKRISVGTFSRFVSL